MDYTVYALSLKIVVRNNFILMFFDVFYHCSFIGQLYEFYKMWITTVSIRICIDKLFIFCNN